MKLYLEEKCFRNKLFSNRIICKENWTILKNLGDYEIDEIAKLIKTRRRPHTRIYIQNFCEALKKDKIWTRWQVEQLQKELVGRKRTLLNNKTNTKLNTLFSELSNLRNKEEMIEKQFSNVAYIIHTKTNYQYKTITKSLYILYSSELISVLSPNINVFKYSFDNRLLVLLKIVFFIE